MQNIDEEVLQTVADYQGIPVAHVKAENNLRVDLAFDSLDTWDLASMLEEIYGVTFQDSDVRGVVTVQDMICLIRTKLLAPKVENLVPEVPSFWSRFIAFLFSYEESR